MSDMSLYEWNQVHSGILSDFAKLLDESGLKYFILRNFEGLPESNSSKDIDIIIEPGKYKKCKQILLGVLRKAKFSHYYIMHYERAHCFYGMDYDRNLSIHIDLIEGYANKGYEILGFDELYSNTVYYKSFRVLKPSYDAVMLLLYKIVGVRELKQKYQDKISLIYENEKLEILSILKSVLGSEAFELVQRCLETKDFSEIVSSAKLIGSSAKNKALKKNALKTFIGWLDFYFEKAYYILWCPPKMRKTIAVEAPDGTGKTTFIENLKVEIAKTYVSEISKSKVYHFRPEFLPNLGAAGEKAGVMKQDKDFTNPHRAKPAGFVSSLIRMTYYWIDYLVGVPIILRKNAQFDKITIFDRYIYDFLVDPFRTRIKLPFWIRKIYSCTVKQPKLVFVLDADADTIYSRKQELTKEEISRQLIEFRKLKTLGDRAHFLDATKKPDEIVRDAMKFVLDTFTNKF